MLESRSELPVALRDTRFQDAKRAIAARVAELVGLADAVADADLVLTGEGSFDAQSALGKGPVGVADLACAHGVPVVVLAGRVEHPLGPVGERVDAAFGVRLVPEPVLVGAIAL